MSTSFFFFFSSRRRHTRCSRDWSSDVCSSDLVRDNQMVLRFDRIEPPGGKVPLVATVTGVVGKKNVKNKAGDEGEIQSASHRGRDAAIGAAVLGGIGAAVGATQGGGKGAAIGAATGGGTRAGNRGAARGPQGLGPPRRSGPALP